MMKLGIKRSKKPVSVITCKQVTQLIMDYINSQLDSEQTRIFEEHLRDCKDCLAFLNTYKKTVEGVRSMKPEDIPQKIIERVRNSLMKSLAIITLITYLC